MTFTLIPNRNLTVITSTGKVITAVASHPNWNKIMDCLKANDEAGVVHFISMKTALESFGSQAPTGDIQVRNNEIFYRTEKLYGEDVNRILYFIQHGIPSRGMIRFLERELKNVSKRSIKSMYCFLENKGMPITDNGTFLGYKGVRADFFSFTTGKEPLIEGERREDGAINNSVGQKIRMERRFVCDDFRNPCGPGLHVGSLEYALRWAGPEGKVVIVEVDPADVVSVPEQEHSKLRCCGYRVVGEYTGHKLQDVYNNDYVRPENEPVPTPSYEEEPEQKNEDTDIYNEGFNLGLKHGKSHHKRLYYEVDRAGTAEVATSMKYIEGYLDGYRQGRYGRA